MCLVLYIWQPLFVKKYNEISNKYKLSFLLICNYSFTISLVCGIIALFISSKKRGNCECKDKLFADE